MFIKIITSAKFERLLFNKLDDFFSPQLSGSQFGFMRRKSTVLQLVICLQAIYNNVDTNTDCYALYLDFSKAFDSVSHATLLEKLRLFGIGGSLLRLLSRYLTNRVQCVKLNILYQRHYQSPVVCLRDQFWVHSYFWFLSTTCRPKYRTQKHFCMPMILRLFKTTF